jgi:hypothetical protein
MDTGEEAVLWLRVRGSKLPLDLDRAKACAGIGTGIAGGLW